MKIGIDFDGVILDTERWFKYYADYYAYFNLNGMIRKKEDSADQKECFDWKDNEYEEFFNKYFHISTNNASFLPGAEEILQKLKAEGHQIYLITSRKDGYEFDSANQKLKLLNVKFDDIFLNVRDKYKKCKELGIKLMVDDNPRNIEQFINKDIETLYFKDVKIRNVFAKNIKRIDTWMDIYLEVQKLSK